MKHLFHESQPCVCSRSPAIPWSMSRGLAVVFSRDEGDEATCQQIMGAQDKPPGLRARFRLSAATARKFKSVGGVLKPFLFLSYLVAVLPWAPFQHDIWTGAPSRTQSSRGKSDASCFAIKSCAFSRSPRKFQSAGAEGAREMNRANSYFYEVSGAGQ